ncbi:MAG: glycoside hydrolase family 30 beta sandwich domain-containing protein, partial [Kiritimatiellales bacterium]
NIVLDETGGPNHQNNMCSAPIIADTQNDRLLYQSSYYYIGHFSKFIRPGALRLGIGTSNPDIDAVSFANLDGSIITVILNTKDRDHTVRIRCQTQETVLALPAHSIATAVFTPQSDTTKNQ